MGQPDKIVISASRRTDIPAFYMDWFMDRLDRGFFETVNPHTRMRKAVPNAPENIHSIVFWSKNFGPFLREKFGERLSASGYRMFFNFTINSDAPSLEPHVPPLDARLTQISELSRRFDPKCIQWRFDPICFFKTRTAGETNNLNDFPRIAGEVARAGIRRCVTSFLDMYPKILKRPLPEAGFAFVDPSAQEKRRVLLQMARRLSPLGISLFTCCEKEAIEALPPGSGVRKSACIPGDLLIEIHGGPLTLKKDTGQRTAKGCGCVRSVDIGIYHLHRCGHHCLFCYANPGVR
jgi:hypothetical protein